MNDNLQSINIPSDNIAEWHQIWKLNRDIIKGIRAVKSPTNNKYLPMPTVIAAIEDLNLQRQEYEAYLSRAPFFPAAARILDGLCGLVFRKPVHLKASTSLTGMLATVTRSAQDVDDLAEEVTKEVFTTNFCGIYVDHPPSPEKKLTLAEYEKLNLRPFISVYKAETILEATPGPVKQKRGLVKVRLLDNDTTVRQLELIDGVYQVTLFRLEGSTWVKDQVFTPDVEGKPLDEIPFYIATTKAGCVEPSKSVMDDICTQNLQMFQAQANAANLMHICTNPILAIFGAGPSNVKAGLGQALYFEDSCPEKPVTMEYVEPTGTSQAAADKLVESIYKQISALGLQIIAPDTKAGVESAEALMLRKTNEHSVLANQTKTISRAIKLALDKFGQWANNEDVEFAISTDFLPTAMTPQERAQVISEWQAGFYSHETAMELFIDGEVFKPEFDIPAEIERVNVERANQDRPLNDKTLNGTTDQESGDVGE